MADPPSPQRILVRNRDRALMLADRMSTVGIYRQLEIARQDLRARLARVPVPLDGRFTAERMRSTLVQIEAVMGDLARELNVMARDRILEASELGMQDTVRYLHDMEKRFTGITTPLALDRAVNFSNQLEGVRSTLLRSYDYMGRPNESSMRRYGEASVSRFEQTLTQAVIQQKQMDAVVDDIASQDTFFEGRRYWAERIVRTEILNSYGKASQRGIAFTAQEDWPDLRKVLVGYFDDRTGSDTHVMDGQTRKPNDPFIYKDPEGRRRPPFQHTPKRPNCRCVTVAWRPGWPKPDTRNPLWGDVGRPGPAKAGRARRAVGG